MTQESTKSSVDELLQYGLELYGRNQPAEAIRCWQQVLALAPGEARALEYLECAGASPAAPPPQQGGVVIELQAAREARASAPTPASSVLPLADAEAAGVDRALLERLLREKRFEDALLMLYRERERSPGDPAISRGIRMLKEHLSARYARELGSLDRVPVLVKAEEVLARATPEQRQVLRLIDGLATFGDVLVSSRLGRYETYRLLATLLERGAITARTMSFSMHAVRPPSDAPPPPSTPLEALDSARAEAREALVDTARARSEVPVDTARARPEGRDAPIDTARARPEGRDAPVDSARVPEPATQPSPAEAPSTEAEDPEAIAERAYERLFARATEAYLTQEYEDALTLYEQCLALRPSDWRAENNLKRLRARLGLPSTSEP